MPVRTLISLLSCVFALVLAGCGSGDDGTIPPDDAENLLNYVTAVQGDISDGECDQATQHAQELVSAVGQLPNSVDPDVANELAKASTNLEQLADSDCTDTSGATGESGAETSTSTTTSTPETTSTTTVPETSTSTDEETTKTQPEEEAPTEAPNQTPPTGQNQGQGTPPSSGGGPASGGVTGGGNAG